MARSSAAFRSILVPLDGSPFGEAALPWASALASAARSRLRLALVHRMASVKWTEGSARTAGEVEATARRSERDYLRYRAMRVRRERSIRVTTAVLEGPVAGTLARYGAESGTDLVVMSTHGRGPLRRAWLGSVADELIRTLPVPLLLVRPTEGGAPAPAAPAAPGAGDILVPLDGSPLAEAALEPAAALARLLAAPLTLLQVVPPVAPTTTPSLPGSLGYDENLTAARREQAQDYLDSVADRLRGSGLHVTAVAALGGNPAESVLEQSRTPDIQMVVLATHGRGGLRRLVMGSVADKLIRGAERPVLVVRPSGKRGRG